MSIKLKRAIKGIIKKFIPPIIRIHELTRGTMEAAFRAIVKRKHSINTIIDIGASDGRWSASIMKHFPHCQYLLIEAQPIHEIALNNFNAKHANISFILAAAGENHGQIYFDATDPFGGQASYVPYQTNNLQVSVTTIDHEVQSRNLPGPYLLKFDTHGFEVPILKGAINTLENTEVIIMECYNFKIAPECLLFNEMCDYLKVFGFRCIDFVEPLHRPQDNSLWQMDLVFVKDNRPEFSLM